MIYGLVNGYFYGERWVSPLYIYWAIKEYNVDIERPTS